MAQRKTAKKEVVEEVKTEVAEVKEAKTYSKEEVDTLIAQAVAQAVAQAMAKSETAKVVNVKEEVPPVRMIFMDDCADDNVLYFGQNGKFGIITGPIGYINVPKDAWFGEFRDNMVQNFLAQRKLVVLDGLSDAERELHGVSYKKGEVLEEVLFRTLLDHVAELPEIFKRLCPAMRQIVASRFQTGYDAGDQRVLKNRDVIVKLNKISKEDFKDAPDGDPRKNGLFANIVRGLNKNDE